MKNLNDLLKLHPNLTELRAELASRSFLDFVKFTKPDYQVNWHHQVLAEHLQAFADYEILKLMVFMPPQHGKSELTSRRLTPYLFGKEPDLKIIGCSYGSDLAIKFCRDIQRIIDDDLYRMVFPNTTLSGKNVKSSSLGSFKRTSDEFEIVGHSGRYLAAGVGNGITGNTCDVGIIDDPIKGYVEANSPTVRKNVWGWYASDFLSRKHSASRELITQTRWHPEDLSGRVMDSLNEHKDWVILKMEAIKTQHFFDSDKRNIGDVLWKERHDYEKIMNAKKADPIMFDALYQQDPSPAKGSLYCHTFDRTINIADVHIDETLQIHHSTDFNVNPFMSGLVIQINYVENDEWNGYNSYFDLKVVNEHALKHPENNSPALGKRLDYEYQELLKKGFYLYGDASGNNRTGLGGEVNTHMKAVINGYGDSRFNCTKRVPTSNPKYARIGKKSVGRRYFLNQVIGGLVPVRVRISPKCVHLINDLENAQQDINGRLDKRDKDENGAERYGHMLQAFEYFICHKDTLAHLAIIG